MGIVGSDGMSAYILVAFTSAKLEYFCVIAHKRDAWKALISNGVEADPWD